MLYLFVFQAKYTSVLVHKAINRTNDEILIEKVNFVYKLALFVTNKLGFHFNL